MSKLTTQIMTEVCVGCNLSTYTSLIFIQSDISAMLERKQSVMSGTRSHSSMILERSRLQQAKTLALRRNDRTEVRVLEEQLAALDASTPKSRTPVPDQDDISQRLAKVNERNRKANLESVRRAEQAANERKREERERKKAASGFATPKNGIGSKYALYL